MVGQRARVVIQLPFRSLLCASLGIPRARETMDRLLSPDVVRQICYATTVSRDARNLCVRQLRSVAAMARACRAFSLAIRADARRFKQEYNDSLPAVLAARMCRSVVGAAATDRVNAALIFIADQHDRYPFYAYKTHDAMIVTLRVPSSAAPLRDRLFSLLRRVCRGGRLVSSPRKSYKRAYHCAQGAVVRDALAGPHGRELMTLLCAYIARDDDQVLFGGKTRTWRKWKDAARVV